MTKQLSVLALCLLSAAIWACNSSSSESSDKEQTGNEEQVAENSEAVPAEGAAQAGEESPLTAEAERRARTEEATMRVRALFDQSIAYYDPPAPENGDTTGTNPAVQVVPEDFATLAELMGGSQDSVFGLEPGAVEELMGSSAEIESIFGQLAITGPDLEQALQQLEAARPDLEQALQQLEAARPEIELAFQELEAEMERYRPQLEAGGQALEKQLQELERALGEDMIPELENSLERLGQTLGAEAERSAALVEQLLAVRRAQGIEPGPLCQQLTACCDGLVAGLVEAEPGQLTSTLRSSCHLIAATSVEASCAQFRQAIVSVHAARGGAVAEACR